MAEPRVTAIIVARNGEAYLGEAIDSIICQSFTDWELIVVDDGSIDGTRTIVHKYERELPGRVQLLAHPGNRNCGISASRNLALTRARGEYIGFLDADDVWLPEKLAEQIAIMDADPSLGIVYGRTLIWHSWAGRSASNDDFCYPLGVDPDNRYEPPVLFEVLLDGKCQTPTTCNALVRAAVFSSLGGFEARFRQMFEDQTFFAKALAFVPVYVSSRTWARYRQHSESCSAQSARNGADEAARVAFLRWLNASMRDDRPPLRMRLAIWRALAKASYAAVERVVRHLQTTR